MPKLLKLPHILACKPEKTKKPHQCLCIKKSSRDLANQVSVSLTSQKLLGKTTIIFFLLLLINNRQEFISDNISLYKIRSQLITT